MKTKILITAALLISGAAFAQTNNEHGIAVNSTAKSETTVQTKGATVSEVASANSHASAPAGKAMLNNRAENNLAVKESHKETIESFKARGAEDRAELKASLRSNARARKQALSELKAGAKTSEKSSVIASKKASNTTRAELRAAKKAAIKSNENTELRSPVKAKTRVRNSANMQLSRPHISGSLRSAAGLGI